MLKLGYVCAFVKEGEGECMCVYVCVRVCECARMRAREGGVCMYERGKVWKSICVFIGLHMNFSPLI